jgi:hypothetical protein
MSDMARCGKCKVKTEFNGVPVYKTLITSKGKKGQVVGTCKVCGTRMSSICKVRI